MRCKTYKTEGIIISRFNSREADRILTVFSKRRGKFRCRALGVRKPTSRKSGHVELFDKTRLFLAQGKNLDVLTQAEVVERFPNLRHSLKASKAAFHVIELVDLLLAEGQKSPLIYQELVKILRLINRQRQASRKQIVAFEKLLLKNLGFGLPQEPSFAKLRSFIESIVEKRLASVDIFKEI
jgi:DNA repair protein RecO (recombination protein O)